MVFKERGYVMWTKYDYLCTDCDALIEITACADKVLDPACICGGLGILILLSESDGNAPILTDVSKVTPSTVVKIDSNPYN
jgi:hypothetical protein